jgi:hypothetical protein
LLFPEPDALKDVRAAQADVLATYKAAVGARGANGTMDAYDAARANLAAKVAAYPEAQAARSAPRLEKSLGAAKFMQRNWRSIAIGVGVVAVVSLVALAVIFGVPAPVAGLAASIWQGAGSIASEGWKALSSLFIKV